MPTLLIVSSARLPNGTEGFGIAAPRISCKKQERKLSRCICAVVLSKLQINRRLHLGLKSARTWGTV
jgi:hypothetical protein